MLEQSAAAVDRVFHALADGTRRQLIQRLSRAPAAVSELARPLPVSLAAVLQHLQVLEESGLVTSCKSGRVRTCRLDPKGLQQAELWISRRRLLWESRLQRLDALLESGLAPAARQTQGSSTSTASARKRDPKPKPTRRNR
jgi:DNA-binding transcriptional ArsR family regulator